MLKNKTQRGLHDLECKHRPDEARESTKTKRDAMHQVQYFHTTRELNAHKHTIIGDEIAYIFYNIYIYI